MENTDKKQPITLVARRFSIEQCRTNPKTLFIFGDSLERYGEAGQAIIRNQVNSCGIATKKKPGVKEEDYFTDREYDQNCKIIDEEIDKIKLYIEEKGYDSIAFSQFGLGTGLSALPRKAPRTFCYLTCRLLDEWFYNNIEFLQSKQF